MNPVDTIFENMLRWKDQPAIYWRGHSIDYGELLRLIDDWVLQFSVLGIRAGNVCGVYGDYSPNTISLIFALMKINAISVPLTVASEKQKDEFIDISGMEYLITVSSDDSWECTVITNSVPNSLVQSFLTVRHPGLIVFSSGSTGDPKGILHDIERVTSKFLSSRKSRRTFLFLMMDHFGGFNTLLGALAYGGVAICPETRVPIKVCETIDRSQATLLPTTPTFLNLLLASGSWRNYDLSSIELITYGTEVISDVVLKKIREAFPNVDFKQTYGLSELGVLRSESLDNNSTWVKIGGEGFQVKIVDGVLWVKAESNMVGYINASQPFDDDGWMCTDDEVEVEGEYIRFLGRKTDIINVGGQKVFPAEVENVLIQAPNITDATVRSMPHRLLGQAISAEVVLNQDEDLEKLSTRLRNFCRERLDKYKVPMRFSVVNRVENQSTRFKKIRG